MKTFYRVEATFDVKKGLFTTQKSFIKDFNTGNLLQDKIDAEIFYSEGLGNIMIDESTKDDDVEIKLNPYGLTLNFIADDPIDGEFVYTLAGYNEPEEVIAESEYIEKQFLQGRRNIKLN